ncbi:FmdB family zinc ribbon protein [Desulfovibrio inopinatus]|uniref:FmdB family zinc ribbon protein n=1 Tax=Desulfovibrio inopinatus TaxID=102109 RepID=UPI0003F5D0B2|nr:zinc ribbon domain-containing protein [Desulfovibrio inopinatus]
MPIYEYVCDECGKEFEEIVFGDPESVPCPKCSSTKTHKLMSRCRTGRSGGELGPMTSSAPSSGGGGCAGCSGGSCSTCG